MAKKEKEKKSTVNIAVAPSLVEDERALEVFLTGCTALDAAPDVLVRLRINNEQHSVHLRDAVKEALAAAPALDGDTSATTSALPPLLPLARQLVQVGDTAARQALLNHRDANRIDVYALPSAATAAGGEAGAARRPSRGGAEKRTKAAATAGGGGGGATGGAKGKGPAANAANHGGGPPDGARCLGGVALSLIPLLTSTTVNVTVPLSVPVGGGTTTTAALGVTELRFRVCCRDAPLLTPQGVLQCRPVVLRVGGLAGLPSTAHAGVDDGENAIAAAAAATTAAGGGMGEGSMTAATAALPTSRLLRARVQLGDACVLTPGLSVAAPASTSDRLAVSPSTSQPLLPSLSLATHSASSFPSATTERFDAPLDYYEHVLFLSDLGNPLEVYRQLYAKPCTVSLWQSFNSTDDDEAAAAASPNAKGTQSKRAKSETLLGSGGFSVRDFLADDQVRFSEAVQLLPDRSAVSLAGGQTCLTTASTVEVTLNFFHPFPPVQHVDDTGVRLQQKAFLTHAVLRLPYAATWMPACLRLLLQEVTSLPRATGDVQLYTPPPPSPSAESQDALEKTTSSGRGAGSGSAAAANSAGGVGGKVSTAAPGGRASKKKSSSKPDTGGGAKGASRAGGAPSAELAGSVPPPPPPPAHPFDAPLQVITPPGLSGFEVSDGQERIWCLEGTVPEVHRVLTRLTAFLESHHYPSIGTAMLFNAELFVPGRSYLTFPALVTPPAGVEGVPSHGSTTAATAAAVTGVSSAAVSRPDTARLISGGAAIALEVEPSGTGGRCHRIRLRTPLAVLRQTQAHYVRHALSDDCLDCLRCLHAVLRATSMREVAERAWLPTAPRLIALERSFGQTLEKEDLFGATPPPSPTRSPTSVELNNNATLSNTAVPAEAGAVVGGLTTPGVVSPALVMDGAAVGTLVAFDGAIQSGGGPRRPIPSAARQRFSVVAWMVATDTGEEILCAFAHSPPTGLVQYHVEGQVVQAGDVVLLYVVKCVCLARSFTHSHNAEYEKLLRERQRAQQTHLVRKTVLWPTSTASANAATGTGATRSSKGRQQQQQQRGASTTVDSTSAGAVSKGFSSRPSLRGLRTGGGAESDDDDADGRDWLPSDFYDHLDASPSPPTRSPLLATTATTTLGSTTTKAHGRDGLVSQAGTRARVPVRGAASTANKAITDEELWRMYDERAPAATMNVTVLSGTGTVGSGSIGKLPPLHH